MGGIFVSYRRDDSRHAAGRLVDQLIKTYASDQVFIDIDGIDAGANFAKVLTQKLSDTECMLVIIGPQWLTARDPQGNRRLDNPRDFVRMEIETALKRKVRIVPVLIDGALPPAREDLPSSIADLSTHQAIRLSHETFGTDVARLVGSIKVKSRRPKEHRQMRDAASQSDQTSGNLPPAGTLSNAWIIFLLYVGIFGLFGLWMIFSLIFPENEEYVLGATVIGLIFLEVIVYLMILRLQAAWRRFKYWWIS